MIQRGFAAFLSLIILSSFNPAVADEAMEGGARFAALQVYVDSESIPLAAWQFELSERNGLMQVVGVENGESAAFRAAPYFDREAVRLGTADRIIVADFSLENDALPRGKTRIATIHVRLAGAAEPDYELRLTAAGNAAGANIQAEISLETTTGT